MLRITEQGGRRYRALPGKGDAVKIIILTVVAVLVGASINQAITNDRAREEAKWRELWKPVDLTAMCRAYWQWVETFKEPPVAFWEGNCKVWYGGNP